MVTELSHGQMETNTLENLKIINGTGYELTYTQMDLLKKVFGKIMNLLKLNSIFDSTKKFIVFFISFILIFNPSVLYAKTIHQKTKFSKVKCNIENLSFMDYFYCLDDRIFRDIDATKSTKKTYDLKYITYTAQVIADTVEEGLISDNQAKFFWNDFINSDYKKRLKKKKLQKILDNSKCLENKDYKIFINCFYKEFRNLEVYKAADIINKYRISCIISN